MPERLRKSDLAHDMNGNVKAYEVKIRRSERSKGVVTMERPLIPRGVAAGMGKEAVKL